MDQSTLRRPYIWNRPMTTRDPNTSRIDLHAKPQREFADESTNPSLLDTFLDIPDYSPRLEFELPTFRRIFDDAVLKRINNSSFELPGRQAAWLHDRSLLNEPRSYNGSISLLEFDRNLKLKRINEEGHPDADTRRIYITNPCQWTLGVLALRAPDHETPVVRDLMFKYLTGDTSIGLDSTIGGEFVLEFHMAYSVWTSGVPLKDMRATTDGNSLRKSLDLSFLSAFKDDKSMTGGADYLHECQTSICVTGRDTSRWTATGFADSYFNNESDPNDEYMLPFYDQRNPDPESCELDALSIAGMTADQKSVKDPREYFLLVTKFRTERISDECTKVVFKLKDRINQYTSNPHISLTRRKSSLGTANGESDAVEASEAWVRQTSSLLVRLITEFSKIVESFEKFLSQVAGLIICQTDENTLVKMSNTRFEVRKYVDKIAKNREELKGLKSEVDEFAKQLGLRVAVGGNRAIVLQHYSITILQFVSPLALAGSTMQAGVKFGNPLLCFVVLTFITGCITYGVHPALTWRENRRLKGQNADIDPDQLLPALQSSDEIMKTGYSVPTYPVFTYRRFRGVPTDKELV